MEKEQYKKEYTKRSTVEGPFGTLKEHYHIENKIVIGKTKTEERINRTALAYNIRRIYNMMNDKKNKKEDIIEFCEDIVATHQLKLDVNIL